MSDEKIEIPLHENLEGVAPKIPNEKYKKNMVDPTDALTEEEDRECSIRAIEKVKREHDKWAPGDRADVVKRPDNLKPEGKFEEKPKEHWRPGEKAIVFKHPDNLQPEGSFTTREKDIWAPGERAAVVKRSDNLKPEGNFEQRQHDQWTPGRSSSSTACLLLFLSKVLTNPLIPHNP